MPSQRFQINSLNILSYIQEDGLTFEFWDIDAPDAGRTLDGLMHRNRVATKVKILVTCRPLTSDQVMLIRQALASEYITVRYIDPVSGQTQKTMYLGNMSMGESIIRPDGTALWKNFTFHLIER